MEISEVRVKLVENKDNRLRAFCSVTLDDEFVVRDIKIIKGEDGHFVAMPSRKLNDHCEKCGCKNHLHAKFCNHCGTTLSDSRKKSLSKDYAKQHFDIAHPINPEFRKRIQTAVFDAFKKELELSQNLDVRAFTGNSNADATD